jgi:hypothetical protein
VPDIVKTTGDGVLVEFGSVVDALRSRSTFNAAWPSATSDRCHAEGRTCFCLFWDSVFAQSHGAVVGIPAASGRFAPQ